MPQTVGITVPWGAKEGDKLKASTDDGRMFSVRVPMHAKPGMTLMVTIPDPVANQPASTEPVEVPDNDASVLPKGTTTDGGVKPEDLTACFACCCCIESLYCKPECFGCHTKTQFICLESEALCCKPSSNEGSLCICCKNEFELIKPTVCIKQTGQTCCCHVGCSVPCDKEVPCMITALGFTCMKDYKMVCQCATAVAENDDGGAPSTQEIARE